MILNLYYDKLLHIYVEYVLVAVTKVQITTK